MSVKKNSKKGKKVGELKDTDLDGDVVMQEVTVTAKCNGEGEPQTLKEKLASKINELRQKRKTYSKQELIEKRKQKPKQKPKKKATPEMKGIPSALPDKPTDAEAPAQMFNIDFGEKKKVKHIDSKALLLKVILSH